MLAQKNIHTQTPMIELIEAIQMSENASDSLFDCMCVLYAAYISNHMII